MSQGHSCHACCGFTKNDACLHKRLYIIHPVTVPAMQGPAVTIFVACMQSTVVLPSEPSLQNLMIGLNQ